MVSVMGALASIAMAVNLHKSLRIFMGCSPLGACRLKSGLVDLLKFKERYEERSLAAL
jgi:hypothetical protein